MKHKKHLPGGVKEMMVVALPMVVSHACETIMIFTDRLFLSRLGPVYMNASMGGGLSVFMVMTFFLGLTGYTTALVAQYLGAGQKDNSAKVLSQAVIISFIAYPLLLMAKPLAFSYFEFIGVSTQQLELQKIYFSILLYMTLLSMLRNCFSAFFSGLGRTKIVMISALISMLVNVAFNYVFIFGKLGCPALGIVGAAYGTILGSLVGLLVLLASYLHKDNMLEFRIKESFVFSKEILYKFFKFGSPAGFDMFLNILAFNTMILIFHAHNDISATAATIVFNWDMVSFVPLMGIKIGVTSLFGRYHGARQHDVAHRSAMSGLKIGWVYSSVILVLFVCFPEQLVSVFRPENGTELFDKSFSTAVFMLRMASIYVLVEAVIVVFIGALRGAGDSFWAMVLSVTVHWLLIPILYLILRYFNLSAQMGWVAVVMIFLLFALVIYLRYASGKWKQIEVVGIANYNEVSCDDFHERSDV